jgi:hypothetical protein
MTQSEDYKKGYQDALAYIRSEIEKRIADKEKFLEQFPLEDYVSSVASKHHNIKLGLGVAKVIIDKHYEDI